MNFNLHTHSTFCDGAGTPEQMVVVAIEKGFAALGFSSHSDMVADLGAYKSEVGASARSTQGASASSAESRRSTTPASREGTSTT